MRLASVTALLLYCSTATARLSEQHRLQQIQSPVTGDLRYRVPGNNNATFGATPLKDQLFDIQFLDVTPFPIVSDELYYMYLYGLFWPDHSSNPTQADLDNATLSFTFSIIYADGSQDVGSPYTIPLRTTLINRFQHMGIRNEDGLPTDRMSLGVYGENDIVADGWIYKQYVFLETTPYPIDSNDLFFVYLSGWFLPGRVRRRPGQRNGNLHLLDMFDRWWHLSLRNSEGDQIKHLTLGDNDLILDWIIYREYSVAGNWTMEFDARIPDGRCLFDVSVTHWIDGDYHRRPDLEADWASKAFRPIGRHIAGGLRG
nr:hypothetical protein B0A51_01682 [Rachicladosporium sp. CCFEE 5018]